MGGLTKTKTEAQTLAPAVTDRLDPRSQTNQTPVETDTEQTPQQRTINTSSLYFRLVLSGRSVFFVLQQ